VLRQLKNIYNFVINKKLGYRDAFWYRLVTDFQADTGQSQSIYRDSLALRGGTKGGPKNLLTMILILDGTWYV